MGFITNPVDYDVWFVQGQKAMKVKTVLRKWLFGDAAADRRLKLAEKHIAIQREGLRRALEEYHSIRAQLGRLEDRLNRVAESYEDDRSDVEEPEHSQRAFGSQEYKS